MWQKIILFIIVSMGIVMFGWMLVDLVMPDKKDERDDK